MRKGVNNHVFVVDTWVCEISVSKTQSRLKSLCGRVANISGIIEKTVESLSAFTWGTMAFLRNVTTEILRSKLEPKIQRGIKPEFRIKASPDNIPAIAVFHRLIPQNPAGFGANPVIYSFTLENITDLIIHFWNIP
jgi:hypothetical protein